MPFLPNVQRLKHHWLARGVEFNDGVSEAAIAAFEHEFGVVLPSDMREYFLTVNGMQPDVTDEEMLRFWTLQEFKPLPAAAPLYATASYISNPQTLFVFADYSIWAHAYAIRLGVAALNQNEIFIIGGDYPILLFNSFSQLIDSYLADKRLMFPSNANR